LTKNIVFKFNKLELEKNSNQYVNNIVDMQVIWYEQEEASCWIRKGEIGKAIHKLTRIEKHFLDFIEDQYAYHVHSYSFSKMTLSAYYKFIKFEDNIFGQKYYVKAAKDLIRCYLELHDNPGKYTPQPKKENTKQEKSNTSTSTRRGGRGARGRGVTKTKAPPEEKKEEIEETQDEQETRKLLLTKNPILVALVHLERLLEFSKIDFDISSLAFEVYLRRGKYLLALKYLVKLFHIDPSNPYVAEAYNRFDTDVFGEGKNHHDLVLEVIELEMDELKSHLSS